MTCLSNTNKQSKQGKCGCKTKQPRASKSGVEGGHSRAHGESKQAEASVNFCGVKAGTTFIATLTCLYIYTRRYLKGL
jgi:hypothetical protein